MHSSKSSTPLPGPVAPFSGAPTHPGPLTEEELAVSYRVLSWNLWSDHPPFEKWISRRSRIFEMLRHLRADIIGFQEVNLDRIKDLTEALAGYRWVGQPRDSHVRTEYNPIFFRSEKFELLWHETLWLSPTPSFPSRGWDAAYPRIVTMARLRPLFGSGRDFLVMNCHLDHFGRIAKRRSVELLKHLVARLDKQLPVLLMGDFNFSPSTSLYRELMEGNDLMDTSVYAAGKKREKEVTWRGIVGSGMGKARLDYLFARNMQIKNYQVVSKQSRGAFPSDHYPVLCDFNFQPSS